MPRLIERPPVIRASGNKPKRIEEYFEEITVVLRGRVRVEHEGGELQALPAKRSWSRSLALGCVIGCSSPSRSLVVLRPAAGDIWTEGKSYTISWRAAGIARVNVGFAVGGKDKGHAAMDLPASTDSLRWEVPVGFVSGFGPQRSDDVRVRVEDARDPTHLADSPSFTIVASGR